MMMNGAENWMAAPSAPLLTRVCCLHHLTNFPRDWSRSWANELQPPFSSPVHLRRPTWLSSFIFLLIRLVFFIAVHVEGSMDYKEPSFVEALERETAILAKRVAACKSRILIVTSFASSRPFWMQIQTNKCLLFLSTIKWHVAFILSGQRRNVIKRFYKYWPRKSVYVDGMGNMWVDLWMKLRLSFVIFFAATRCVFLQWNCIFSNIIFFSRWLSFVSFSQRFVTSTLHIKSKNTVSLLSSFSPQISVCATFWAVNMYAMRKCDLTYIYTRSTIYSSAFLPLTRHMNPKSFKLWALVAGSLGTRKSNELETRKLRSLQGSWIHLSFNLWCSCLPD